MAKGGLGGLGTVVGDITEKVNPNAVTSQVDNLKGKVPGTDAGAVTSQVDNLKGKVPVDISTVTDKVTSTLHDVTSSVPNQDINKDVDLGGLGKGTVDAHESHNG